MKTISTLFLISAAIMPIASADIPKKAPLVKYTGLWTNSPFTSKPVVETGGTVANPFDDFTLTGIAPVPGGYRITIMSKKNPEVKKVIEPGVDSEFSVVSVDRNPGKVLGTTVVLSSGSIQGTVAFEPDLITLKAAPAAPQPEQAQPAANTPPGIPAAQPNGQQNAQRQPRPRIVPPPAPSASQPSPSSSAPGTATQGGRRDERSNRRR